MKLITKAVASARRLRHYSPARPAGGSIACDAWDWGLWSTKLAEAYSHRNGIRIVKFFLHVSKEEQKKRFLARIDTPSKNWKFEEGDVKERGFWKEYMHAYEEAIRVTGTEDCPWYVVPADDKKNMRLIVSAAILHEMQSMKLRYPELPAEQKAQLEAAKKLLLAEK